MYNELHCPICGSTNIIQGEESFNYKAALIAILFLHLWGLLFGWFGHKRTTGSCSDCNYTFIIND